MLDTTKDPFTYSVSSSSNINSPQLDSKSSPVAVPSIVLYGTKTDPRAPDLRVTYQLNYHRFHQGSALILKKLTLSSRWPHDSWMVKLVSSNPKLPLWSSSKMVTQAVLFLPISNLEATPPRAWRAPESSRTLNYLHRYQFKDTS